MIKKVYSFNSKGETLIKRQYAPAPSDTAIRGYVISSPDCNFVRASDMIIYKKIDTFYLCFVVNNENEMYIFALISQLAHAFERRLGVVTEMAILCNFKECHLLVDEIILNGKLITANLADVLLLMAQTDEKR
ncbi:AP-4 complex subunit sigma-1 [Pancytospora epiphaga]|nr:AP-4 complex subunit sigma-1 [Pancytospora epiphaga]